MVTWIGLLLVAGAALFTTGAMFWKPAQFQKPLAESLPIMAAHRRRLRWILSWMIAGVVTTTLGLVALRESLPGLLSAVAVAMYAFGAVLMVGNLAFRLTVMLWAADETARSGVVSPGYAAWSEWMGLLHMLHLALAYLSAIPLGLALLQAGLVATWLGWAGVGFGVLCSVGLATLGGPFLPPILAHVFTLAVGVALLARG